MVLFIETIFISLFYVAGTNAFSVMASESVEAAAFSSVIQTELWFLSVLYKFSLGLKIMFPL